MEYDAVDIVCQAVGMYSIKILNSNNSQSKSTERESHKLLSNHTLVYWCVANRNMETVNGLDSNFTVHNQRIAYRPSNHVYRLFIRNIAMKQTSWFVPLLDALSNSMMTGFCMAVPFCALPEIIIIHSFVVAICHRNHLCFLKAFVRSFYSIALNRRNAERAGVFLEPKKNQHTARLFALLYFPFFCFLW